MDSKEYLIYIMFITENVKTVRNDIFSNFSPFTRIIQFKLFMCARFSFCTIKHDTHLQDERSFLSRTLYDCILNVHSL